MAFLRILATLVTGGIMLVGGVALALAGPSLVVVLGIVTAAVGVFYTFAGISSEGALRRAAIPTTQDGASVPLTGESRTSQETVSI